MDIFVFYGIVAVAIVLSCIFVHKISSRCENTEKQDFAILEG
jgi:hypothetical protein